MNNHYGKSLHKIQSIFFSQYFYCALVFIVFFSKAFFFNWYVTGEMLFSSIVKHPLNWLFYYSSCLGMALAFTALASLIQKRWWVIVFAFIIDFALLANTVYFRTNGLLLNGYTLLMADNMSGFWDAVTIYILPKDFIYFTTSIILLLYCIFCKSDVGKLGIKYSWGIAIVALLFLGIRPIHDWRWGYWLELSEYEKSNFIKTQCRKPVIINLGLTLFNPFNVEDIAYPAQYVKNYSPYHYFITVCNQMVQIAIHPTYTIDELMTPEDIKDIGVLFANETPNTHNTDCQALTRGG